MIRPVLTEIGIFLIPFAVYALFLAATRSGVGRLFIISVSRWADVRRQTLLEG